MSNFWRPELLSAPNIPKPLHTVNPRTIKGKHWWDSVRQKAYAKHDYRCYACGTPKQNADFYQWLEAHEDYDIDWKTGRVELREIVALCHCCHNFIHNGRLWQIYKEGQISKDKAIYILDRGFDICNRNKVIPYYGAYISYNLFNGMNERDAEIKAKDFGWYSEEIAPWEDWHLIIDEIKYYSPFKNLKEWEEFFN